MISEFEKKCLIIRLYLFKSILTVISVHSRMTNKARSTMKRYEYSLRVKPPLFLSKGLYLYTMPLIFMVVFGLSGCSDFFFKSDLPEGAKEVMGFPNIYATRLIHELEKNLGRKVDYQAIYFKNEKDYLKYNLALCAVLHPKWVVHIAISSKPGCVNYSTYWKGPPDLNQTDAYLTVIQTFEIVCPNHLADTEGFVMTIPIEVSEDLPCTSF